MVERISSVLVQEGDRVSKGQVLARLDTSRLEPQVAQAEAVAAAQKHVVERMHNGSRPEEIAQARANLESAKVDAANAQRHYERFSKLSETGAVSKEDLDNAKAALDVAELDLEKYLGVRAEAELNPFGALFGAPATLSERSVKSRTHSAMTLPLCS